MIELIRKNGVTAPIITCDQCSKRIKDVSMGMVFFSIFNDGEISYRICHKGNCDTGEPCSQELSHFLVWLLSNVGLKGEKLDKAIKSAKIMELI